jgi:EmrB/QacA subfamily drug resistance transporter
MANIIATKAEEKSTTEAYSPAGRPMLMLAVICTGIFLAALDQTVIVTILPQIISSQFIPLNHVDQAGWIVTSYLLGYTVAMPLLGRVADVFGRKRVYLGCLLLFLLGSVGCGLTGSGTILGIETGLPWLYGWRAVQALGGGAILPIGMAMTRDLFPAERRTFAIGVIGAVAEGGGVMGPIYGAGIISQLSWQWVFFINVPLGLIAFALVAAMLKGQGGERGVKVDWLGGLLLSGGLLLLTLALSQKTDDPVNPKLFATDLFLPMLLGAIVCLALFVAVQRFGVQPLFYLREAGRGFISACLANFLVGAALIIAMVNIPIFGQTVLGLDNVQAGLVLLRMTAFIPIGAFLGGWLAERLGYRLVAVAGLLFAALGFWLMNGWRADIVSNQLQLTLNVGTVGFGFGLLIAPLSASAINAMPARQAAFASATVTFSRLLGMTLGLPTLGAVELTRLAYLLKDAPGFNDPKYPDAVKLATLQMYTEMFLGAVVICLLGLLPALFLLPRASKGHDPIS